MRPLSSGTARTHSTRSASQQSGAGQATSNTTSNTPRLAIIFIIVIAAFFRAQRSLPVNLIINRKETKKRPKLNGILDHREAALDIPGVPAVR
jgi:hypothetical protein